MAWEIALAAVGGALGTVARFGLRYWAIKLALPIFYSTLLVNLSGSLLIGILLGVVRDQRWAPEVFLLLGVGFLGGFTTFSSFSWETFELIKKGESVLAFAYAAGSILLGLGAAALGYVVASRAFNA